MDRHGDDERTYSDREQARVLSRCPSEHSATEGAENRDAARMPCGPPTGNGADNSEHYTPEDDAPFTVNGAPRGDRPTAVVTRTRTPKPRVSAIIATSHWAIAR